MKILIIISGSIAVSKCYEIFKRLESNKIQIDCIITDNAKKMINLKKLKKSISGKVYSDTSEKNNKMLHIELTRKNNLVIVCPATSNLIAKFANGYADDLASTSLIASNKQVIFIPAMNVEMWNNRINQNNIIRLKNIGVDFIGPEHGRLSCGEIGLGRMSSIGKITKIINQSLEDYKIFKNKRY